MISGSNRSGRVRHHLTELDERRAERGHRLAQHPAAQMPEGARRGGPADEQGAEAAEQP